MRRSQTHQNSNILWPAGDRPPRLLSQCLTMCCECEPQPGWFRKTSWLKGRLPVCEQTLWVEHSSYAAGNALSCLTSWFKFSQQSTACRLKEVMCSGRRGPHRSFFAVKVLKEHLPRCGTFDEASSCTCPAGDVLGQWGVQHGNTWEPGWELETAAVAQWGDQWIVRGLGDSVSLPKDNPNLIQPELWWVAVWRMLMMKNAPSFGLFVFFRYSIWSFTWPPW